MNKITIILCLCCFSLLEGMAQDQTIKLYKGTAPGSEAWDWQEAQMYSDLFGTEVVYNVTDPSLLVFEADKENVYGTAIVIAPGGGFQSLSINREGTDLAKKLAAMGITAFVLKYRLLETTSDDPAREMMNNIKDRQNFQNKVGEVRQLAGDDIKNALRHIRNHSDDYSINPEKVGVIGFSAGGAVILESVLSNEDSANLPNFAAAIYSGAGDDLKDAAMPQEEIPMFIAAASDDQLGLAPESIKLYNKWLKAAYPVELHMYANGGHGFGMGEQGLPVDTWDDRFFDWLEQFEYLEK